MNEETDKFIECTEDDAEEILSNLKSVVKENGLLVMSATKTDNSYDTVCKITSDIDKQGGQLNYNSGHEGLGVAFRSGFGDGKYEVFAIIIDCGQWGERVSKVEIILIEEEDLDD